MRDLFGLIISEVGEEGVERSQKADERCVGLGGGGFLRRLRTESRIRVGQRGIGVKSGGFC